MKSQIKKIKNRLLDLNFLRKALGYNFFARKYSLGLKLKILDKPKSGRVLVLAPHPDDEVLGCGGILAKHRKQKDRVKVIYLTSNRRRREEARLSTQILGINELSFLGFEDGHLSAGKKEVASIEKVLTNFKPDIIYAPYFIDSHSDHQATAEILGQAVKKSRFQGKIWSYEIWTPILANRIIRIDDVFAQKVLAIKAYQSQLKDRDYLRAISGLNAYRARMFGAGERAEAFFVCKSELYQKILGFRV